VSASVFGLTDSGIHAIHTRSPAIHECWLGWCWWERLVERSGGPSSIIFIKESTAASYSSSRSSAPERSKPARRRTHSFEKSYAQNLWTCNRFVSELKGKTRVKKIDPQQPHTCSATSCRNRNTREIPKNSSDPNANVNVSKDLYKPYKKLTQPAPHTWQLHWPWWKRVVNTPTVSSTHPHWRPLITGLVHSDLSKPYVNLDNWTVRSTCLM